MGIYNSQSVCQTGQALGHYLLTWLDVGPDKAFFVYGPSLRLSPQEIAPSASCCCPMNWRFSKKKKNKKRKKNIKIYSILNICAARTCCWSINTHHSQLCFVLLNFKYEAQNICYLPASCCQLTAAFGC